MVWAYVFITTRQSKNVVRQIRQLSGVVHADALFGGPDVIAVVADPSIPEMDAVIDRRAEIPDIQATDSKVARLLDGIQFPVKP